MGKVLTKYAGRLGACALALMGASSGSTHAQTPATADPAADPLTLDRGPAGALVAPAATTIDDPTTGIATPAPARAREVQVAVDDEPEGTNGDDVVKSVPPDLQAATRTQAPLLRDCRNEIAHRTQQNARAVPLGDLSLRFTIQSSGAVSDAEVVALGPTHPDVMTCVRDRLLGFRYDLPPPDDVRVAYTLPRR